MSWHDAQAFIEALNRKEGITGYRLPTEAEWEYACRAGSRTSYYWGDQFSAEYAVAGGKKSTAEVGSKKPNAWGLYDMSGNVWEWMQSQYQPYPYSESDGRNAEDGNAKRVLRGGSFSLKSYRCRSAYRNRFNPVFRFDNLGFRIVLLPSEL